MEPFLIASERGERHRGITQPEDAADISRNEPRLVVDFDYADEFGEVGRRPEREIEGATGGTARFLLSDLGSEIRGSNIPTPSHQTAPWSLHRRHQAGQDQTPIWQ